MTASRRARLDLGNPRDRATARKLIDATTGNTIRIAFPAVAMAAAGGVGWTAVSLTHAFWALHVIAGLLMLVVGPIVLTYKMATVVVYPLARDAAYRIGQAERDHYLRNTITKRVTVPEGWSPSDPDTVTRTDLLWALTAMTDDDLRAAHRAADTARTERQATERQTVIAAYEAHISNPDWRAVPGVEWIRTEAQLRSQLPEDYPLPDGVTR